MFNTICWILIGLCVFYIIRNYIAGSLLYPACDSIVKIWDKVVPPSKRVGSARKNYYLFVLNPFLWTFFSPLKKTKNSVEMKEAWKKMRQTNL